MPWNVKKTPEGLNDGDKSLHFSRVLLERRVKNLFIRIVKLLRYTIVNEKKVAMKSIMVKFMKHDE